MNRLGPGQRDMPYHNEQKSLPQAGLNVDMALRLQLLLGCSGRLSRHLSHGVTTP